MEGYTLNTKRCYLSDFTIGLIVGFVAAAIIFGLVGGLIYFRNKSKEQNIYV